MSMIYTVYKMTTNPVVTHNLYYEAKREGTTVYYRFKITTEPITGSSFFAYDLKMDITINGNKLLSGGTIKNSSPSQWSNSIVTYFPHSTGWYSVSGISTQTELPCICRFYSTQTSGSASSGDRTVFVPVVADSDIPNVKIKINGSWNAAKNIYVKASGVWKEAKKMYIKVNGVWKEV